MNIDSLVQDGVNLLDDYFDGDRYEWARRINPSALKIMNPNVCILGQVFGGFVQGCEALDIQTQDAVHYGMDMLDIDEDADFDAMMFEMEECWRLAILEA